MPMARFSSTWLNPTVDPVLGDATCGDSFLQPTVRAPVPVGIEKAGTLLLRSVPAYVFDQQEENA